MAFQSKLFSGLTAVALVASSTVATAQITARDPDAILQAMLDFDLIAKMGRDEGGDPRISSRISDTKFWVYFYGCEDNRNCASIMFKAGYDLNNGISALKINEWNRDKRFVKAYIDDEGDPFIEFDVNLAYDGMGEKNFMDNLDWWRLMVEDFEDFIEW